MSDFDGKFSELPIIWVLSKIATSPVQSQRQFRQKPLSMMTICVCLCTLSCTSLAQSIRVLRYDDDFSYLLSSTHEPVGNEKLKNRLFSKRHPWLLSLGGEVREWYEIRRNPNFGDLPPGNVDDPNGSLQHRFMLHANVDFNNGYRVFGQLNNTWEFGNPNPPVPEIIEDGVGVHQLFVDIPIVTKGDTREGFFRLGRQEFSFGDELMISTREGPNNRRSFDAISYIQRDENYQFHILAATPVIINRHAFDNTHNDEALWGVYGSLNQRKKHRLDLYYLGFYSQERQYNYQSGTQLRHTIGARLWHRGESVYYDVDMMLRGGRFENETIRAANITAEVRYVFQDIIWKPMIGFGASYVTGDYSQTDDELNTFDPLYPKPVYGLATPQGPSNIAHLRPTIGLQPLPRLYINFRWYQLWRASAKDGTYAPSMVQVRPVPGRTSDSHDVATQYSLDIFYVLNENLSFITFLSYVEPGAYVQDTGAGKDVYFWASALQYKF